MSQDNKAKQPKGLRTNNSPRGRETRAGAFASSVGANETATPPWPVPTKRGLRGQEVGSQSSIAANSRNATPSKHGLRGQGDSRRNEMKCKRGTTNPTTTTTQAVATSGAAAAAIRFSVDEHGLSSRNNSSQRRSRHQTTTSLERTASRDPESSGMMDDESSHFSRCSAATPSTTEISVQQQQQQQQQRITNVNTGLAEAMEVVNQESYSRESLALAEPYSEAHRQAELATTKRRKQETLCCIAKYGCFGFACLVLVIFLAVFFTDQENTSQNSSVTHHHDIPMMVMNGVQIRADTYIKSLLPDYTLSSLQEPSSPQSLAFQWMLADPHLPHYDGARIIQRISLATFFYATDGNQWTSNKRWLSHNHHECQWFSNDIEVQLQATPFYRDHPIPVFLANETFPCEDANGTYTHLWLYNNNLKGRVPQELYLLTSLMSILLYSNAQLEGSTISTHIGQLSSLNIMSLLFDGFAGTVPTEVGVLTNLHTFYVPLNNLHGSIPSQIGLLSDTMVALSWDQNQLTGTLPVGLGNLSHLTILSLEDNLLSGSFPTELGQATSLTELSLDANQIDGSLPSELGLLTNLKVLSVNENQLSGTLAPEVLRLLGTTDTIALRILGNNFSGSIPNIMCEGIEVQCFLDAPMDCVSAFTCSDKLCGCDCPCPGFLVSNVGNQTL